VKNPAPSEQKNLIPRKLRSSNESGYRRKIESIGNASLTSPNWPTPHWLKAQTGIANANKRLTFRRVILTG
jgi:hypothetical protein